MDTNGYYLLIILFLLPWILLIASKIGCYSENKIVRVPSFLIFYSLFFMYFWAFVISAIMHGIEAFAIIMALPLVIIAVYSILNEFQSFMLFPAIVTIISGVLFFAVFWIKYKKNMFIVTQFFMLFLFILFASEYQRFAMEKSSEDLKLDCYVITNTFLESISESSIHRTTLAEGYKDDTPYLWSYKNNRFVPIDKNRGIGLYFISKEACITRNKLKAL